MCGRLTMTVSETAAAEGGGEAMSGWTRVWEDTRRMLKRADLVLLCLWAALFLLVGRALFVRKEV